MAPGPILVGIDGTSSGLDALALGSALAALSGADLVLGAVHGYETLGSAFGPEGWPSAQAAREWLAAARATSPEAASARGVVLSAESVAHGLVALARREDAAVIVLGSSRRSAAGRLLAGTGCRRVAAAAPCAIAIAPRDWPRWPQARPAVVGAAIDGSRESLAALAAASALAREARLRVLIADQTVAEDDSPFATAGTSYADWRRERQALAARVTEEALAIAPGADVRVLDGDPVRCLAEASAALDLLVVGSRRSGPIRSTLLGSVSSALAERAACPLLVVPRGADPDADRAATIRHGLGVTAPWSD